MAKRKPGMTDTEWQAYKARVERRAKMTQTPQTEDIQPFPTPDPVVVPVGVMTVTVEAGLDCVLGTPDDKVTIRPQYDKTMPKSQLLAAAKAAGITDVSEKDKKSVILAALLAAIS